MTKTIARIVNHPEWSVSLKILKLENLALRTLAASPNQKEVIAAYQKLQRSL